MDTVDEVLGQPVSSSDRFTKQFKVAGVAIYVGGDKNTPSNQTALIRAVEFTFKKGSMRTWQDAAKAVGLVPAKATSKRVRSDTPSGWAIEQHWTTPNVMAWWDAPSATLKVWSRRKAAAAQAPPFPTLAEILKHKFDDMDQILTRSGSFSDYRFGNSTLHFEWTTPPERLVRSVRIEFHRQSVTTFATAAEALGLDASKAVQSDQGGKPSYQWEALPEWSATWDQSKVTLLVSQRK